MGEGDGGGGGGDGSEDVYKERAEPVLVLLSDSYSEDNSISVCDSRPSSSPAYTATNYFLSTDYYHNENVNNVVLRRTF